MKKIKLLLFFLGIGILFVVSEIVFICGNNDELSIYTIKTAEIISSTGNVDGAIFVLERGAGMITTQNSKKYSLHDVNPYLTIAFSDEQLKYKIRDYLYSLPNSVPLLRGKYDLARVFYDLSILFYKNGQPSLTPNLLNISIGLNPTLSYWQVELANYYMRGNDLDMTKKVLDTCLKIETTKQHCQDYLNNNFIPSSPEEVGFLEPTVRRYYESDLP